MDTSVLAGYSLWDHKESDMIEWLTLSPFYNFRAILGSAKENTNLNSFKILMLINKGKTLNCSLQHWLLASKCYPVILLEDWTPNMVAWARDWLDTTDPISFFWTCRRVYAQVSLAIKLCPCGWILPVECRRKLDIRLADQTIKPLHDRFVSFFLFYCSSG